MDIESETSAGCLTRILPWLLTAGVAVAYANIFAAVFVFDDLGSIVRNPGIRRLWPPWLSVSQPSRAVVEWSFAINYALGRLNPNGYHAVNLAVHIGAALALFGVVRRTLQWPALRPHYGTAAPWLAFLTALLWAVHPLQTESVTYTVQRSESLMGLFALLTLYAVQRSAAAPRGSGWQAAAAGFCALGMATKETMVVVPVMVLLYDGVFLAESWRELWRRRAALYAALAATWILLYVLMAATAQRQLSAGFAYAGITPWQYGLTQAAVVTHYLKLVVWPHPLCFDYAWPPVRAVGEVLAPIGLLTALGALALALLWRRRPWSFPLLWFFLTLAPTSSIVPVADFAFEHRMYLALAAPVAALVIGGYALSRRLPLHRQAVPRMAGAAGIAVAILICAALTRQRNTAYASELALWSGAVAARPDNLRARNNLAVALSEAGRTEAALQEYAQVIALAEAQLRRSDRRVAAYVPGGWIESQTAEYNLFLAYANRGQLQVNVGRREAGRRDYEAALRILPDSLDVQRKLACLEALQTNAAPASTSRTGEGTDDDTR
jgi:tetratricopeptide (TPR) repeat protein